MNESSGILAVLRVLFEAFLRALFPALFDAAGQAVADSAEDGAGDDARKKRLAKRIADTWGRAGACVLALVVLAGLAGCGTRTVYVPDGTPVRLRRAVKNAAVWVLDADGRPTASTMDLPEGWYCLPDPAEGDAR